VLIDTDFAHAFDCDGQLTAIGWIEGESRLAEQLRDWSVPAFLDTRIRLPID
jgi:hypothetical protein